MCHASTTLCYGLWVTTASLNFAAAAHKATLDPVLAIDLIISRRRAGKLEVDGQGGRTTARELPEEVWEMVKQETRDEGIRQAELDTIARLRCSQCDPEEERLAARGRKHIKREWRRWDDVDCGKCSYNAYEWCLLPWDRVGRQKHEREALAKLLRSYRLFSFRWRQSRPDSAIITENEFDTLSAIILQTQATYAKTQARVVHDLDGSAFSTPTITSQSNPFACPLDAHLRFRCLVRDYRLDVVNLTQQTIVPIDLLTNPLGNALEGQGTTEGTNGGVAVEQKEAEPKLFAKDEPRWMLCSRCSTCDM